MRRRHGTRRAGPRELRVILPLALALSLGMLLWRGLQASGHAADASQPASREATAGVRLHSVPDAALAQAADPSAPAAAGGLLGGGLFISGSAVSLFDLQVYGNATSSGGGGLHAGYGAQVTLTTSAITGNVAAFGGGLSADAGAVVNVDAGLIGGNATTVTHGHSGGIRASGSDTVLIVAQSILSDNTTSDDGGALGVQGATVVLTNVLITGNASTSGRANVLSMSRADVSLMSVTVADNRPDGEEAILVSSGRLTVTNTIIWDSARSIDGDGACADCIGVGYSDVEGGYAGPGNISLPPRFIHPAAGNYDLQADSPCIDAGTPEGAPATDLEGVLRDGGPDIGAYEYGRAPDHVYLPITLAEPFRGPTEGR